MSRPFIPRRPDPASFVRVNGKIRAREVRVIDGENNAQLGVISIGEALNLARQKQVDLVEIAPNANPPVCKLVNYGKFRYDQAKKEKESKKHQHANKVKEVQLSPSIDPHDLQIKTNHAIDFLCEDMKVKIALRFRGRENAHPEIGMQLVDKFIHDLSPWSHPDFPPKHSGRMINAMLSPLPKQKRAKHPKDLAEGETIAFPPKPPPTPTGRPAPPPHASQPAAPAGFANNPFNTLKAG